jgi:putative ABC transport system permease protein
VQLPNGAALRAYRDFLNNYAAQQRQLGRFSWVPHIALRTVREWLAYNHVVTSDVSLLVLVSFAFLLVCLLNAVVLMLAKFMSRSPQVSVRRALGAAKEAIFAQCLLEAGVIGVVGGGLGIGLSYLGLAISRTLFIGPMGNAPPPPGLTELNSRDVLIAVALSVSATVLAGLYPTWRSARVQPAWQLKVQ